MMRVAVALTFALPFRSKHPAYDSGAFPAGRGRPENCTPLG